MVAFNFVGKSRTLIQHKPLDPALNNGHTVESMRDLLVKIEDSQEAKDIPITPRNMVWDFSDRVAKCQTPQLGLLYWDSTSWSQLGRAVLPRYGANFIKETARLDHEVAESAMATHCSWHRHQITLRTINKRIEVSKGVFEIRRYVRAVCTQSYREFKDSAFFTDLLDAVGNKPLARFVYGDAGMDAKILMEDVQDEHQMYPVLNAWNSGVLLRNAGVGGGTYRQICSNGMMAHFPIGEHTFVHVGSTRRIRTGIQAGIQKFGSIMTNMSDGYNRSLGMTLEDPYAFVEKLATYKFINQTDIVGIKKSMDDETSSKYGTLANVIDGMTHYAHNGGLDIWKQQDLEKLSSRVMFRELTKV